ncbi:MAG: hypothetical protein ACOX50_02030 [Patescibacteria group bacterium]
MTKNIKKLKLKVNMRLRKFIKALAVFAIIFLFLAKTASALTDQNFEDSISSYIDAIKHSSYNKESSDEKTLRNISASLNVALIGEPTDNPQNLPSLYKGGMIMSLGKMVDTLCFNPPVSSKEYFADVSKNFGVKTAHAQGIGFAGLQNLLPLWKATRNLAYVFFVLIFMYVGLAIMFRVKIDPKTVISIQSALPKFIIALILITFSYAIVGLMIDLIYVLIYLGIVALREPIMAYSDKSVVDLQAEYMNASFFKIVELLWTGAGRTIQETTDLPTGGIAFAGFLAVAIASLITSWASGFALAALLPVLVIAIILVVLVFKLFFALLSAYINIIIAVIIGPIQIMMGAIPGSSGGFNVWFKNLLANILVFPAVILVLLIGWLLTGANGPRWEPPMFATGGSALPGIIGMGLLLLTTKIPDMIKEAFKIKGQGYGKAIGETFSQGYSIARGGYEKIPAVEENKVYHSELHKARVQQRVKDKMPAVPDTP